MGTAKGYSLSKITAKNERQTQDFLDEVYRSSGDIINVRSLNELPRGPSDLYNARHACKKSYSFGSPSVE